MGRAGAASQRGFTIIEVVLVLAIAGLIFLLVFLAVPAMQRSQRDTQRRKDVSFVASQLNMYQTSNRWNIPSDAADANGTDFMGKYLAADKPFVDPWGNDYSFASPSSDSAQPASGQILYHVGRKCGADSNATGAGAGSKTVALRVSLEGGGVFCQNI